MGRDTGLGTGESGWGGGKERGGAKERQSDFVGGACGEGCREGGGEATSPDPREDSDPGSGSWIMSVSQGALGAGGVCVPGPQWVSDGAAGVFCGMAAFCPELRTEGPSGSYRQKSDSSLIRADSHMVVVYVISVPKMCSYKHTRE